MKVPLSGLASDGEETWPREDLKELLGLWGPNHLMPCLTAKWQSLALIWPVDIYFLWFMQDFFSHLFLLVGG